MAKSTRQTLVAAFFALLLALGCSKQSSDSSEAATESEAPEIADKKMTEEIDKIAEGVLQSADKMEVADWLKRYPKSQIDDVDGRPILMASLVARLSEAGAPRIVIDTASFGQGHFLVGMVVVLPTDAAARQKLFAMDQELSQLCEQIRVEDKGQKYLHYSFD